jgi:hypothetical protein
MCGLPIFIHAPCGILLHTLRTLVARLGISEAVLYAAGVGCQNNMKTAGVTGRVKKCENHIIVQGGKRCLLAAGLLLLMAF